MDTADTLLWHAWVMEDKALRMTVNQFLHESILYCVLRQPPAGANTSSSSIREPRNLSGHWVWRLRLSLHLSDVGESGYSSGHQNPAVFAVAERERPRSAVVHMFEVRSS